MPKHIGVCLLFCLLARGAAAQSTALPDTSLFPAADNAIAGYARTLHETSALYNGREYYRLRTGVNSHAYFEVNDWQPTRILYNGTLFGEVPALYDMVGDELVIQHFSKATHLKLNKARVDRFAIAGHTFVRFDADSVSALAPGFYDLLYSGKTQVLARRSKVVTETVTSEQVLQRFDPKTRYYLRKGGHYIQVRRERDLLAFFGDQRKNVQQFLRKNKLKFRRKMEQTLVQATAHFDALNN